MSTWRQDTRWMEGTLRRAVRRAIGPLGALLPGLILLAETAGCGPAGVPGDFLGLIEQGKTTTAESHTDFQTFEYTRTPGLGFDTDPDPVLHATITRMPSGGYWLEMRVWEGGADGESRITWEELLGDWEWESTDYQADSGWDSGWSWQIPTERDLPPRALTTSEAQRMLSLFAAVPVECEYVDALIDYCVYQDVRWDNRSLSANPNYGYSETILYSKLEDIVQMLGDFRSASQS